MSNPQKNQRLPLPKKAVRDFILSIPAMLAVLIGYLFAFRIVGETPQVRAIAIGVIGWVVALYLRAPFAPLAKKLGQERGGLLMAGVSGPCEELIRLAMVLIFGRSFHLALSMGFGWGAVEILFAIISGGARLALLGRDDEKARQAKEILAAQGTMEIPAGWLVGAWERVFATGLHVGFTLLVAFQPWLVVLLLPVHSLVNLTIPKFAKRSIWIVEGIVTVVGGTALILGLSLFGQL
jgi:hypothetical protein